MDKNSLKEKIVEILERKNEESLAAFLASERKKVLFGQGAQAFICYDICKRLGVSIDAFTGSKEGARYPTLPTDIPFYLPWEFSNPEGYDVLLALNESHNEAVIDLLRQHGFVHIYYSRDWNKTNKISRGGDLELYLKEKMGDAFSMTDPVISVGGFKILGLQEPEEYSSMLEGDFFDIIAPSIFNDTDFVREGAYENGDVFIEKDDIVFDLGANIGMFSCVAAVKGKKVYAFEPTPGTVNYLRRNSKLYDNFEVVEAAVSDKDGEASFTINNLSGEDLNTGANTLFAERIESSHSSETISVKTVSLDSFVKTNHVERVDFIKADIEGAERYMLEGAKEILKKHAPKLSLCTYHLQDDPEVMKNIILKYNPNYIIEQYEKKMFAYVKKQE